MATFASSQEAGKITHKEKFPKAGSETTYFYSAPKGLYLPDSLQAVILFLGKNDFTKTEKLTKEPNGYSFNFKAPESISVIIIAIKDNKNKIVDNNNNHGYISYVYDKTIQKTAIADIELATMLGSFANYFLEVKESNEDILKLYENAYKKNPSLVYKKNYNSYLNILYRVKKDAAKPHIIAYAKKIESESPEETELSGLKYLFQNTGMKEEENRITNIILKEFPTGQVARQAFMENYFSADKNTEEFIFTAMKNYIEKFKDSSAFSKQYFYSDLHLLALTNKNWENILKYEELSSNKLSIAVSYNSYAWNSCGNAIEDTVKEPEFAKAISRRSIDIVEKMIKQSNNTELWNNWDAFADTYALLLYKQKQFDSAFYYQDAILKRNNNLGIDGKERYALFANAAKGPAFTKEFIETELSNGITSTRLLSQLQTIYKKLNLPDEEFVKTKSKGDAVLKEKMENQIKAKLGSVSAKNFVLTNLKGQKVSLSSFKNKIVILDFWATWCGPCKASFPGTQQLINQYKGQPDVVFLFIDTWERKDTKTMQKEALNFITKNNYSFEILLDDKDKVVEDYKVDGIPITFIIDKNGKIAFMGHPSNDIGAEIDKLKMD